MGKRKDGLALFEVVNRSQAKRAQSPATVPQYSGRHDTDASAQAGAGTGVKASIAVAVAARPAGDEKPRSASSPMAMTGEPVLLAVGDRMRVSLPMAAWVGVAAGFVVLLVLSFALGRTTANPTVAPPAVGNAAAGTGGAGRHAAIPPTDRIPGKYYLVIQGQVKNRADADAIVDWLAKLSPSEPADVNNWNGGLIVWSLKAFDSENDPKAHEFAEKINELGKKYMKEKGEYNFGQHDKTGALRAMYLQWHQKQVQE